MELSSFLFAITQQQSKSTDKVTQQSAVKYLADDVMVYLRTMTIITWYTTSPLILRNGVDYMMLCMLFTHGSDEVLKPTCSLHLVAQSLGNTRFSRPLTTRAETITSEFKFTWLSNCSLDET